jgi:hypothetical protein
MNMYRNALALIIATLGFATASDQIKAEQVIMTPESNSQLRVQFSAPIQHIDHNAITIGVSSSSRGGSLTADASLSVEGVEIGNGPISDSVTARFVEAGSYWDGKPGTADSIDFYGTIANGVVEGEYVVTLTGDPGSSIRFDTTNVYARTFGDGGAYPGYEPIVTGVIVGDPPAPSSGYVLNYEGTCYTACENLTLSVGDTVGGYISFDEQAFVPGNILENADISAFSFTFGSRTFDSSSDAIQLLNGEVRVNATGNGITGDGDVQFRVGGPDGPLYGYIRSEDTFWSVANTAGNSATGYGSTSPTDAGETPAGEDVEVTPVISGESGTSTSTSIIIDYSSVTDAGETTVDVITVTELQPSPPAGFKLGDNNIYYDFNTTATLGGEIGVCFGYDESDYDDESTIRLYHYHDGAWSDVTDESYPDITNNLVCGTTTTFSYLTPVEVNPNYALSCSGFESPMNNGPVKVKKNRVLPFKALLKNSAGYEIGSFDLVAPPVLEVTYSSAEDDALDVSDLALNAGAGSDGNQFEYIDGFWRFNLKTTRYSASGTYTVTLKSGDSSEYVIETDCSGSFVVR